MGPSSNFIQSISKKNKRLNERWETELLMDQWLLGQRSTISARCKSPIKVPSLNFRNWAKIDGIKKLLPKYQVSLCKFRPAAENCWLFTTRSWTKRKASQTGPENRSQTQQGQLIPRPCCRNSQKGEKKPTGLGRDARFHTSITICLFSEQRFAFEMETGISIACLEP